MTFYHLAPATGSRQPGLCERINCPILTVVLEQTVSCQWLLYAIILSGHLIRRPRKVWSLPVPVLLGGEGMNLVTQVEAFFECMMVINLCEELAFGLLISECFLLTFVCQPLLVASRSFRQAV